MTHSLTLTIVYNTFFMAGDIVKNNCKRMRGLLALHRLLYIIYVLAEAQCSPNMTK